MFASWPRGTLACVLLLSSTAFAADRVPPLPNHCFGLPQDTEVSGQALRELVENDWLRNLERSNVTTQSDAAGACDGVKNGAYGFHTGGDAHPWWQVDLGQPTAIGRIVVYNRLDYEPGLHNADTLQVFSSDDGATWTLRHDCAGQHFGGISGAPPLELRFPEGLTARFIRLLIPGDVPVLFHLDEVEIFALGDDTTNIALRQPADQSSLSPWSTSKLQTTLDYPIADYLDRGYAELARLQREGVDTAGIADELHAATRKVHHLPEDAPDEVKRELYIELRWLLRRLVFRNPLLDFDQLLFMKRFTQETYPDVCLNHMPWVSKPGGDICILRPPADGEGLFTALADPASAPAANLRSLLNKALGPGHVHGIDLWFDGDRVVFGYARSKTADPPEGWLDRAQSYRLRRELEPIHIYELSLVDGRIRQLTFGEWSDLDPTYAPNGDIVFVSERCGTSLQCNEFDKDETSCNLYVMNPDGSGIRRMSVNKDGDYLPHCLDNGMIAYTRWEYHERSWAFIQSIWVVRPDGTGADALFAQHLENPWALEDVRSIPNSRKLVAIAAGHHTLAVGPLVTIDHAMGLNEPKAIGIVTPKVNPPEGGMAGVPVAEGGTDDPGGFYGTPWALSEKCFLVSYTYGDSTTDPTGYGLYYVDVYGNKELIYRDPEISSFFPIPLRPRPHPPILPESTKPGVDYATCFVSDIGHGSEDIPAEDIRYLRIAEPIGWPYDNDRGGQRYGEDHRYGGPGAEWKNLTNWTPVRILGDVPVAPDGSVQFTVPADTAVYFQLLDENRMELRRMRSFISFQPGEARGCVGCHETRGTAPVPEREVAFPTAAGAPAQPLPAPWGDRPVSFLRDVQPVFDAHCVRCHAGLDPAGGFDFSGGLLSHDAEIAGYGHNRAFETILANGLVSLSPARQQDASITPAYTYGARQSRLIQAIDNDAHRKEAQLSEEDRLRLTMWIDANAPYHDRFVNKRPDTHAYDIASDETLRQEIHAVHERRCAGCHEPDAITRLDWINLRAPENSPFLTAPLGQRDGGQPTCDQPVYPDTTDPDYTEVRTLIEVAVQRAWQHPRRDLAALPPPELAEAVAAVEEE